MSVLGFPRVHFHGSFSTNPCTANNDYESLAVDTSAVTLGGELEGLSDEDARAWMMATYEAAGQTWMRCGWNYYADYATHLDAEVGAVAGLDGVTRATSAADALIGKGLKLIGREGTDPVIADVDPRGIITTQLFAGGFQLGGTKLGLTAVHDTRAYTRWRNNTRNLYQAGGPLVWTAGAIFQMGFPRESLSSTGSSPVLDELMQAVDAARGVLLEFCVFLVSRRMSEAQLHAEFEAGRFVSNPVTSTATGTIGVWEADELATAPNGRRLFPGLAPDLRQGDEAYTLGPVAARVDAGRRLVSLDLINAVPEVVGEGGQPVEKVALDALELRVLAAGARTAVTVGTLPAAATCYDAYLRTGGVVDVAYDAAAVGEALRTGQLQIVRAAEPGAPLLSEPAAWVQSDDRALYLEPGERRQVSLEVRAAGDLPACGQTLRVWEYQYHDVTDGGRPTDFELLPATQPRLAFPRELTVADGEASFEVEALAAGPTLLAFTIGDQPPPAGPDAKVFPWMTAAFTLFRVLPLDDYDDQEPTWELVYREVLRYYFVVFPGMSQLIPLNSEQAVRNAASAILDRIAPEQWETTLYMPITRVLSSGKRRLLERWAHSVIPHGDAGSK